jgi:hypothetical protein
MDQAEIERMENVTRRGGLVNSFKLALAAPAAIAALHAGTALADDGDHDKDDDKDRGRGRGNNDRRLNLPAAVGRRISYFADLSRLNDIAPGDFTGANPPSDLNTLDPLSSGWVAVGRARADAASMVHVSLRGAGKSLSYLVQFVRVKDQGRENVGTITTDGKGNFHGVAGALPGAGGKNRAGIFVLNRNVNGTNVDEYVAGAHA